MKQFSTALRFLDRKNVIPVLGAFKLDLDNRTITASNLDRSYHATIPDLGTGQCLVDGQRLTGLLSKLSDPKLTVKDKLIIKHANGRAELPLYADDYPDIHLECDGEPVTFKADVLKEVFSAVLCGTDEDKAFPAGWQNVCLLKIKDGQFNAYGSDGQRLVVVKGECESIDREMQIPIVAARLLLPLIDSKVVITEDRNHLFFQCGPERYVFRKLTAEFPSIEAYLNAQTFKTGFTVPSTDFENALSIVHSMMDDRLRSVKWTLDDKVTFTIKSEAGDIEQVLDIKPELEFNTGYNLTWLLPIARQLDGDVTCEFAESGGHYALKLSRKGATEIAYIIQDLVVRY